MPGAAFVVGGTGQIGRAVAAELAAAGWGVTVGARGGYRHPPALPPDVEVVHLDRTRPGALAAAVGERRFDVLVDVVAFTVADAEQVLGVADRLGSVVVLSSMSVYADAAGRTLDEARAVDDFPRLPVPCPEDHPTVPPGEATYSTRKVALERRLLDASPVPVTVLRPGAVHGPGSAHAREWWVVKRALDRRPAVPLAFRGGTRFHPTSTANLARLVRLAAERPGRRVLNAVDPDAPTQREIVERVLDLMDHPAAVVLMPGPPQGDVGATPWSVPFDLVGDMSAAAQELGYRPATTYREAVADTVGWLREHVRADGWQEAQPALAAYRIDLFGYPAEDAYLSGLAGGG